MESMTKRKLDNQTMNKLIECAYGKDTLVRSIVELTDGYFNASYLIEFQNGEKSVLKVAPPKDVEVMNYEKDLMEVEVTVMNQIYEIGDIKTPKIFFYDKSQKIIDSDYYFMEFIEGVPMDKIRKQIGEKEYREISFLLGKYCKSLIDEKGSFFGSINQEDRQFDSWFNCFYVMISDLFDDVLKKKGILPISKSEALAMIDNYKEALNEVQKPVLIHKDLWEGNIFLDPASFEIKGIIDFERAIYGDPLMEAVCAFLIDNKVFMKAYLNLETLSDNEKIRVNLYRFYILLIMVVECYYRLEETNGQDEWARNNLDAVIKELR